MSSLVIAAPVTLIAFPFAADRRRPWWRRLIRSLAQLGTALAAARCRRRGLRQFFPFARIILVDVGCSPRGL
jgi:hypothetical protein